jgi:hypothetical protein
MGSLKPTVREFDGDVGGSGGGGGGRGGGSSSNRVRIICFHAFTATKLYEIFSG